MLDLQWPPVGDILKTAVQAVLSPNTDALAPASATSAPVICERAFRSWLAQRILKAEHESKEARATSLRTARRPQLSLCPAPQPFYPGCAPAAKFHAPFTEKPCSKAFFACRKKDFTEVKMLRHVDQAPSVRQSTGRLYIAYTVLGDVSRL